MAFADRHAARYRDLAQEHIPEQVLAAGYVSNGGTARGAEFGGPMAGLLGSAIGSRIGRDARDDGALRRVPAELVAGGHRDPRLRVRRGAG